MNTKKLLRTALVITCISLTLPAISNPVTPETELTSPANPDKVVDPIARLQEIKEMNKENLSRTEKKELRNEVKQIKKEVRRTKNGIYLSIGAVAIIVLLLILLL